MKSIPTTTFLPFAFTLPFTLCSRRGGQGVGPISAKKEEVGEGAAREGVLALRS